MDPSLAPRAREALELRGASKNRAFALSSLRRFYRSRYSGRLRALYRHSSKSSSQNQMSSAEGMRIVNPLRRQLQRGLRRVGSGFQEPRARPRPAGLDDCFINGEGTSAERGLVCFPVTMHMRILTMRNMRWMRRAAPAAARRWPGS